MNTYAIATESNGNVIRLDLPLMSRNSAERHASKLRKLMPQYPVYVLNTAAI